MEQETQNPTQENPHLSIQDLVLVFNLVRVAAERGAIKAEEMSTIGSLYERLAKFLQASGALNQSTPATEESAQ